CNLGIFHKIITCNRPKKDEKPKCYRDSQIVLENRYGGKCQNGQCHVNATVNIEGKNPFWKFHDAKNKQSDNTLNSKFIKKNFRLANTIFFGLKIVNLPP